MTTPRLFIPWSLTVVLTACQSPGASEPFGSEPDGSTEGDEPTGTEDDPAPELECEGQDVGFVPIHRLTRAQYANTVRDLLGLDVDVAGSLPADTFVGGFDNNAGSLVMNGPTVDAYYQLAQELSAQVASDPGALERLIPCDTQDPACRDTVVRQFLDRAWRRPVGDDEIGDYVELFEVASADGGDFVDGATLVVRAGLMSPGFLFRLELDPAPDDPEIRALTAYELASRLSYALWNTMPDDALFEAAARGELLTEAGLQAQVERMMASDRALSLVDDFAAQWLGFANIEAFNRPDPERFPQADDALIRSMEEQTRRTMTELLLEDQSLSTLLTHDRVYLSPALAELYGVSHPTGDGFAAVDIDDPDRQGLLGHASILTLTSAPERTSPVKRGLWVMTNLLCNEPPPAPAGVETELPAEGEGASVREILEQHRQDPTCAACHTVMDEIGLGLEAYDAIGQWREQDAFGPIDASGVIPDPHQPSQTIAFDGPGELSRLLQDDPRLPVCIAEKLYTYVLSRVPAEDGDRCRVDQIAEDLEAEQLQFDAAVRSTVLGDSFRFRRSAPR